MTARLPPEVDATTNEILDRLCRRLGDVKAPYDEIGRSRAEARLDAVLARQPPPRGRRPLASTVGVFLAGAAAAAIVAFLVVPRARPRLPERAPSRLQFEPYVVAPLDTASPASALPEALERSSAQLDVPAGWLVRATLGEAVAVTLTGPARAWAEHAANDGRVVVHLEEGRLLASLAGGRGRRMAIVSPGAVTEVVGTLFAVEVVGRASRVTVAHGRVAVSAAPAAAGGQDRASPREVAGGQSWLTVQRQNDELEPALAEALAEHERTPSPRGAAVELSVGNALPGADVWVGGQRIASAPAWVRVETQAAVRVSAPAAARARAATMSVPDPPPPSESPPPVVRTSGPTEPAPRASTPPRRHGPLSSPAPEPTAPAAPPGTAPPPLVPAEVTARSLFREADRARATGDSALAVRTLRVLVTRYPNDRFAAAARYELALMEHATGDEDAALGDLAALSDPALDEPARYLRCRVLAPRASADADRCLADFRRQFPKSPHDADALAARVALALARGGCPSARAPLAELARRYPLHKSLVRLRAACPERP
jgi:TolA-binding protein